MPDEEAVAELDSPPPRERAAASAVVVGSAAGQPSPTGEQAGHAG